MPLSGDKFGTRSRHIVVLVALLAAASVGVVAGREPVLALAAVGAMAGAVIALAAPQLVTAPRLALLAILAAHSTSILRYLWPVMELEREVFLHIGRLGIPLALVVLLGLTLPGRAWRDIALPAVAPVLAYVAWTTLGGLLASDPKMSLLYSALIVLVTLASSLAIAAWSDPGVFWIAWLRGMVIVTVPLNLVSFLAWASGMAEARASRLVGQEQLEGIRGIFDNPGMSGEYALLGGVAMLALRLARPSQGMPWWMVPALGMSAVLTLLSLSRGATAGLVFGGAAFAFALQRVTHVRFGMRGKVIGVLIGMVLVGLIFSPAGQGTMKRITGAESETMGATTGRSELWAGAASGLLEHPLIGLGLGASPVRAIPGLSRLFAKPQSAHSAVVDYMIIPGIPASLLMMFILSRAASGLSRWRRSPLAWSVGFVICTMGLPFLVNNTPLPNGPSAWVFWLPLVVASALRLTPSPEESGTEADDTVDPPVVDRP